MSKAQKIKGFADLFPPESDVFTFIEATARETFSRYAFGELRTPLLEKTEVFAKGIGEDTDVVGKEMYTFADRKGRSLTLRPEATAGVMRAFIEAKVHQPGAVHRFYTLGPMFRYERPQKGRMRQFHQVNAELIGSDSPLADAEVILMLADFLTGIGLKGLTFEVNTLGCAKCRPAYRSALADHLAAIDDETLCEDCLRRRESNPLRVLDCKVPGCKAATADAPTVGASVCPGCRASFDTVLEVIDRAGLSYEINERLVRGLDYYVGTTFEVTSTDIGSQSSVAGGGRYDGLIKLLGGPDVPGVGFACGMERLALLVDRELASRPDFYVAVLDEAGLADAAVMARTLRQAGLSGEASLTAGSMKSQMRRADKTGAGYALILGTEEIGKGTVQIKNLSTGEQTERSQEDLAAHLGSTAAPQP